MDVEVKALLNKTLGSCSDDYRATSAASSPAPLILVLIPCAAVAVLRYASKR
jgi:hypothetical protein